MKTLQTAPGTIAPDKPSNICLTNFRPVFKGSVSAVGMFARLEACTGMRPLALSGGDFILAAGNGIAVLRSETDKPVMVVSDLPCEPTCALRCGNGSVIVSGPAGQWKLAKCVGGWKLVGNGNQQWPAVSFRTESIGAVSVAVGQRRLANAYNGISSLSAADRKAVAADFAGAYRNAVAEATARGTFVAPVLAFCRAYDSKGALLFSTPPVAVMPAGRFVPRVDVPVVDGSAVSAYSVDVPAWRIKAVFDAADCPEVASVEVLVSNQFHSYSPEGSGTVSALRGSGAANILRVSLPGVDAGLEATAPRASQGRLRAAMARAEKICRPCTQLAQPFVVSERTVDVPPAEGDMIAALRALNTALATSVETVSLRDALLRAPHSMGAARVAAGSGTVAWGNLRALRSKGFPPVCFAASTGPAPWRVLATVTFGNSRRGVSFGAEYPSGCPQSFWPVFSYPSPDATQLRLTVHSGGITRSGVFALTPDGSGLRSVYISPDFAPLVLPEAPATTIVDITDASEDFPEAIALCPQSAPAAVERVVESPSAVAALCHMGAADGSWDYGRCRFAVGDGAGLHVLTVDRNRRSAAMRMVAEGAVCSPDAMAASPQAVFAALPRGLLRLDNTTRRIRWLATESFDTLAWESGRGELFAMGYDEMAHVFSDSFAGRFMHTAGGAVAVLMASGVPFAVDGDGVLMRIGREVDSEVDVDACYTVVPRGGLPVRLQALAVHAGGVFSGTMSATATGTGGHASPVVTLALRDRMDSPVVVPLMFRPVRNLEVRLAGRARTGFSFMGVNFRYG